MGRSVLFILFSLIYILTYLISYLSFKEYYMMSNDFLIEAVMIAVLLLVLVLLLISKSKFNYLEKILNYCVRLVRLYPRRCRAHNSFSERSSKHEVKTDKQDSLLRHQIMLQLEEYETTAFYLNPQITLAKVAVYLNRSPASLSEAINESKGVNFNTYVNSLRIAYICKQIYEDSKYRKYKISHLASVSGFLSHSTFTKVFKNLKGISPSEYIEMVDAQNENNR